MATTTFATGTVIASAWLNDVNDHVYESVYNVKLAPYGATGDGTTDDTAAINAAQNAAHAAGGGIVYFPVGTYKVSVLTGGGANVVLQGANWKASIIKTNSATGNVITTGRTFKDLSFTTSVTRTGGSYIIIAGNEITIDHCYFEDYHVGVTCDSTLFDLHDCYFYQTVSGKYAAIEINGGIDVSIRSTLFSSASSGVMPTYGILVHDVSDLTLHDLNVIYHGTDLALLPGTGEAVPSVYASQCYFDTATNGLNIQTTGTGQVLRCSFSQCWFSSHTNVGINTANGGGTGTIDGLDFIDCQVFLNTSYGMAFSGTTNVRIVNPIVAANGASGILFDGASVSDFSIIGGCSGGTSGLAGNTGYGVLVTNAAATRFLVTDMDLVGNTVGPISNSSTSTSQRWVNNMTGASITVASATTTTLPSNDEPLIIISGTTTITSVAASWVGRKVTLQFLDALTFTDGSNLKLAGNFSTSADDTISLVSDGTSWFETGRSAN